ncbi:YfhH family protein [Halalkalibacter akibai]|uniref:Transcription regulator CDS_ID OB0894 n=1 Tax=Halalkalibacter akibai (strain ATCC 43226 / DSM 21942 / CIP 109018 / JCM 9157 / 1139) TaxID=1236973 RepID=W4QXN1_HALA3|nr:YfhH family protein [Halalkalibacter akibai]GAE36398.1 transcription regulator CDS_ID OB0894 [Halalkalibacter akibai JCM 9157]
MEPEKRFSQMTEFELRTEIARLNEKAKKAEQMGMSSEFAVYERRVLLAKAYLLNPEDFKPGTEYKIEGGSSFKISYMNGYFAWGYRDNSPTLEGVPISLFLNEEGEA